MPGVMLIALLACSGLACSGGKEPGEDTSTAGEHTGETGDPTGADGDDTDTGEDLTPPQETGDTAPPEETASDDTSPPEETGDTGPVATPDCSGGSGWATGGWLSDVGESSDKYLATAFVYVPKILPDCAPLLFWGHGGTAAGGYVDGEWADPQGTGLVALADKLGFVLIAPGVGAGQHYWGDEPVVLDHLQALVEAAWDGADLDRDRTWFIAQSAGCYQSVYMGLYIGEPWTGIGAVACGLGGYYDYPSTPLDERVPFYVAHDPTDTVVPYSRSEYLAEKLEEYGHTYTFDAFEAGGNGHGWGETLSADMLTWLYKNATGDHPGAPG
jgi:hypothetical protein